MSSDAVSQLDAIRQGYAFEGPHIVLGAAVEGGEVVPDAVVRLPLGQADPVSAVGGLDLDCARVSGAG